jgi:hypothetical protein
MINKFDSAMDGMFSRYSTILSHYYPSHDSTGFTERNLTNNFVFALEEHLGKQCISWFEAPICRENSKHIDAVVFYDNVTILIEAKRFTSVGSKIESVNSDIERMHSTKSIELVEAGLGRSKNDRKRYSVVLADVWTETGSKSSVYENWPNCISGDSGKNFVYSNTLSFSDLPVEGKWKENYKILIAVSEIKI